jgi:N-acetylglucosamine malate deacetylase 1
MPRSEAVMDVLVVAPHPDDEVLGCGGSILIHRAAGRRVGVVFLTSGELGSAEQAPDRLAEIRKAEARRATAALGVDASQLTFLRLGDGRLNPYDLDQVTTVVGVVRRLRPRLMYLPHASDGSFDHRAAFELCWRALGLAASGSLPVLGGPFWVPVVLGYEVWAPIGEPGYAEDITGVLERKLAAVGCYSSQAPTAKGAGQATHVGPDAAWLSGWRGAASVGGHREVFTVLRAERLL